MFGRFGSTEYTIFNEVQVGKEYLVMGIVIFENYQSYLIDDGENVFTKPCQLFEVIDSEIGSDWHFRLIGIDENIYPFVQAVFGYYEFCAEGRSYEGLVVENDSEFLKIYFEKKKKFEDMLLSKTNKG